MKKLILSIAGTSLLALSSSAQGIALADNSPASFDNTINGVPNTTQDLNLELLLGTSAGTITTPVVTLLNSVGTTLNGGVIQPLGQESAAAGDISFFGTIDDQSGAEYTLSAYAGQTLFFEIEAWTGQYNSYAAALASGVTGESAGTSSVFSEAVPTASNSNPIDVSSVGVIGLTQVPTTIIPEPSTLAMAGVGLASMLFMRRKIS